MAAPSQDTLVPRSFGLLLLLALVISIPVSRAAAQRLPDAAPTVRYAPFRAAVAQTGAPANADTTRIAPNYGVEFGIIGAVVIGGLASTLCDYEGAGSLGCHLKVGILVGGALGFPLGALLGGQIRK